MATTKRSKKKPAAKKKTALNKKRAPKKAASKKAAPKSAAPKKASGLASRVMAIDWKTISNGQADGFAEAFARLEGTPKERTKALDTIRALLRSRNGRTYPIAGLAMPFFVELLASSEPVDRAALLAFMTDATLWGHRQWMVGGFLPATTAEGFLDRRATARTYEAFAKGEPIYRGLLGDVDAAVRAAAAFALAWVHAEAPANAKALAAAFDAEADPIARASLALSLAVLAGGSPDAAVTLRVAERMGRLLSTGDATEQLAGAIACSFLPGAASEPRVLDVLQKSASVKASPSLPWCGGALASLAKERLITAVFGEAPAERPKKLPALTPAQEATLRALLDPSLPKEIAQLLHQRGFPNDDRPLRRLAGIGRKIPEGKHARVFDRWMTWAETGESTAGSARELAAQLAAETPIEDAISVVESMYYAQQDASDDIVDWPVPELPNAVRSPDPKDDSSSPGSLYRWYRGTVDDLVRAYEAVLRSAGYTTWSHGKDGDDDLHDGDVVGWHAEGREVNVGFDQKDGLVRVNYEWGRSLVWILTRALCDRHGAAAMVEALRARKKPDMRAAIGLVYVGWAIAEHTGSVPDPFCDELAFRTVTNRHYIYWTGRAHLDRIPEARREQLVLRLLGDENGDQVFGWVRFAPTPAVRAAATKMVPRTFGCSYSDLEGAEAAADRMMPFVDASLLPVLREGVAKDENPTMQTIMLGRLGEVDVVQRALESAYPMARAAAKKALKVVAS